MQEAGNKVSRDMLKSTYRAYKQVVELVIELIRQFYDIGRVFRVVAENGAAEYVSFDAGQLALGDRKPIFDIEVSPQKSNPFNRLSQNEFAKELYQAGIFRPDMADQALAMLDMMEFEGKQKVVEVQQGQPRQTVRSGSSGGTSAQAYERAASLAQGAEQRRFERSSPVKK